MEWPLDAGKVFVAKRFFITAVGANSPALLGAGEAATTKELARKRAREVNSILKFEIL